MSSSNRLLLLIAIMTLVTLAAAGVTISLLFSAAMNSERTRLTEIARSQARLIESVAEFDTRWSQEYPGGAVAATLEQVRQATRSYAGFGETGEFTLARREHDQIRFLLAHRHRGDGSTALIPWGSDLAEPMRQALSGRSMTLIGRDYRGARVLAATEPLPGLGWGLVAKIDLDELRRPFLNAGLTALSLTLLLAGGGAVLFVRLSNPLLRRLRESEARFRALFEHAPLGIALLDREGRSRLSNHAFQSLLGRDQSTLAELRIEELLHPEDLDDAMVGFRAIWSGESDGWSRRERYLRPDGTEVWGQLTLSLVRDLKGQIVGALAMVADMREQRRMENELAQAYERALEVEKLSALGSFVGGIAHEINNPLMALSNYVAHVEEQVDDADLRDILRRAQGQVRRIGGIVDGVLRYASSGEEGSGSCDLRAVVEFVAGLLKTELASQGIVLVTVLPPQLPRVGIDRELLEQSLMNLVLNATYAVRGRPLREVRVIGHARERVVELRVEDTGPGIAPSLRPRIFDPFFTTKPPGDGTGLGLGVTQRNLSRCGGRLRLLRADEGDTCFAMELPVAQGESEAIPEQLRLR
jgi:PAS domain S-box-containing protein